MTNWLDATKGGRVLGTPVGPLTNISIANVGSGNNANAIPTAQIRNVVIVANPNPVVFYVHPKNGTAGAGQVGSIPVPANGTLVWPGNGGDFIPTDAMSVAGTSGMGVTILTG